jgi:hypothetical protein
MVQDQESTVGGDAPQYSDWLSCYCINSNQVPGLSHAGTLSLLPSPFQGASDAMSPIYRPPAPCTSSFNCSTLSTKCVMHDVLLLQKIF